ncbi:unnamed protein product [Rodentolepis nana]|uniref:Secreted protein n=1 Tax=Rodentolepis nana TaxID=102285 RepID=A0A0R3THM1_RODNA|nr:unnamed protein product [Rodentolepis nana]
MMVNWVFSSSSSSSSSSIVLNWAPRNLLNSISNFSWPLLSLLLCFASAASSHSLSSMRNFLKIDEHSQSSYSYYLLLIPSSTFFCTAFSLVFSRSILFSICSNSSYSSRKLSRDGNSPKLEEHSLSVSSLPSISAYNSFFFTRFPFVVT